MSTDKRLATVAKLTKQALAAQNKLVEKQTEVIAAQVALRTIVEQRLPEAMQEAGLEEIKLSDGTSVTIKQVLSASLPSEGSIAKEKDEARRAELQSRQDIGTAWLRDNNAGAIIQNRFQVQLSDDKTADSIERQLQDASAPYKRTVSVNYQTLNSYFRERLENGLPLPTDEFNIFTGQVAFIKQQRKDN